MVAFVLAVAEHSEHGAASVWAEYLALMGNAAHWLFEFTLEFITFLLAIPFGKWWGKKKIAQHDAEHHPEHECQPEMRLR